MHEVVIVGGGIAGASMAYFLAERGIGDVVILEREEQPGCHATGRSAAVLYELDPIPAIARLKVAGGRFLRNPPPGFSEAPLLRPCGVIDAHASSWPEVEQAAREYEALGIDLEVWTPDDVAARVPVVDPRAIAGALWVARDGQIDVHALLAGYLAGARAAGAELRCGVEVTGVLLDGDRCAGVATRAGDIRARWVVDAAGAWAGALAQMAGAAPIPIAPKRRCAAVFEAPPGVDPTGWPMVCCDDRSIYFEPESGGILMSPMDEAPSDPCDARPDELTIAEGFDRLARLAPPLEPRTVRRRWAGLRSFAPDRIPVVGRDPVRPGFFWLAGQGGCGIETSAAVGAIAADLLADGESDGPGADALSPVRFA